MSNITGLDHIVLIVRDLAAAEHAYTTLFGRAPSWRTKSADAETLMFTLGNMSLEVMAPLGEGAVKAALDTAGEGLASLVFRVGDVAQMHRRLTRLGLEPEDVVESSAVDAISGASLSWRRTRAATKAGHGVRLFFLEREAERQVSAETAQGAITGLDHVVVQTPAPERAAALYGARLGLDMRLDRTSAEWGSRLMFFRCGDLVVEIIHRLGEAGDGPDKLWGLSWRVADAAAAQARLKAAGVDVSEVRRGRKPGTHVFTVRDGTCGVPTLMVQVAS
ncbi:glyoxalase/Bleomycin resistance protein/Dioxygenase superfamily protein [Variibacter gotjawalensis]|uniref:Glyoxalase/Bleomycin resistance protein/Dioxygenase superfamily protein n=1 Tax=Variibacter gotjawalensis TaxID=1333996 RepID=A0A0S3PYB2_9BRAD|nr:VOC family protein [Variibacter gotjawalensis]NIK46770.1 catechol 2,3-dioxygenase-like lactoylglutathione lyase family enzyme [Variibacter gotjawalensis]RZS48674.1 glyoxalase-like protein [Variibacter gotjawalensis]BAT60933.1 glyoxalase/Bleomycin resistance protein/Dioxygenase superfamily protein [Variibacter gotjawalensis]